MDGPPLVGFLKPRDALKEWRRVTNGRRCDYSSMTYELTLQMGAVRWPCNERTRTARKGVCELDVLDRMRATSPANSLNYNRRWSRPIASHQ